MDKEKCFLGVDPGKRGCLVLITENRQVKKFPFTEIGKEFSVSAFLKDLESIMSEYTVLHAVIEDVHAIFGSSAKSTFSFGYICGQIEAVLICNKIPFTKVSPKIWQKEMFRGIPEVKKPSSSGKTYITDTKTMSISASGKLFPNVSLLRTINCKKPDDNVSDALLMAEYCRRKY